MSEADLQSGSSVADESASSETEFGPSQLPGTAPDDRRRRVALLCSVFVVAACGLVYELVAASVSSYLLGDAVTQFSLVIGVFLSAMGLGAYLAQYVKKQVLRRFVEIEIWIGLIGGLSSLMMFAVNAFAPWFFQPFFYACCITLGAMVGVEIPLLVRLIKEGRTLTSAVSQTLALDYTGALVGSLCFPLLVLPLLGLSRASVVFGLLNLATAAVGVSLLSAGRRSLQIMLTFSVIVLLGALAASQPLVGFFERQLYDDEIIYAETTPYQRAVVTRFRDDVRLYLNGHVQFSSVDEARYHESLVIPAMRRAGAPQSVLILGGGDGMAAREALKYDSVETLTLVDLDPAITDLGLERPEIVALNQRSLHDERVTIHNEDAMRFLEDTDDSWDVILIDLPDPNTDSMSKLYSTAFYRLALRRLSAHGVLSTQATSPFFAKDAFWCIVRTMEEAGSPSVEGLPGIQVTPYHAHVPSFGEWGFVLAARGSRGPTDDEPMRVETRYLTPEVIESLFVFGRDLARPEESPINRLEDPVLYTLYRRGWQHY